MARTARLPARRRIMSRESFHGFSHEFDRNIVRRQNDKYLATPVEISRMGPDDIDRVLAASPLFDGPARREWVARFLATEDHHLLVASVDSADVGFVSGVEMTHPDKGTEMFLYELGVDEH